MKKLIPLIMTVALPIACGEAEEKSETTSICEPLEGGCPPSLDCVEIYWDYDSCSCRRIAFDTCGEDCRCDLQQGCVCNETPDETPHDCDDGIWCNGVEALFGTQCLTLPGSQPCPPIEGFCCVSYCDETNQQCLRRPNSFLCNPGDFCDESCQCRSNVTCATDADCLELGDPCSGVWTCRNDFHCWPEAPIDPSDNLNCSIDACVTVPVEGCEAFPDEGYWVCHTLDDSRCGADEDPCNGIERCTHGGCVTDPAPDCDDEVDCTRDFCDSSIRGCEHVADSSLCSGSQLCHPKLGCTDQCGSDVECITPFPVCCDGQCTECCRDSSPCYSGQVCMEGVCT